MDGVHTIRGSCLLSQGDGCREDVGVEGGRMAANTSKVR